MESEDKKSSKASIGMIIALVLFIVTLSLFFMQVIRGSNNSQLETALFGILQLSFSVYVSWYISYYFSKKSFIESQKKFAVSAYRRIKEIQISIEKIRSLILNSSNVNRDVVIYSIDNLYDSTCSSVADWLDVIEDEVRMYEEYDRLKKIKNKLYDSVSCSGIECESEPDGRIAEIEKIDKKIANIKSEIPSELRAVGERIMCSATATIANMNYFYHSYGCIVVCGYSVCEGEFMSHIDNFNIGDRLNVRVVDSESGDRRLFACDFEGKNVGIITDYILERNGYKEFVESMIIFFGYDSSANFAMILNCECFVQRINPNRTKDNKVFFKLRLEKKTNS